MQPKDKPTFCTILIGNHAPCFCEKPAVVWYWRLYRNGANWYVESFCEAHRDEYEHVFAMDPPRYRKID